MNRAINITSIFVMPIMLGLFLGLFITALMLKPTPEPIPVTFDDCPAHARMPMPVTATYSFMYCMTDSTVRFGGAWEKPSPFEQRHINWHLKGLENYGQ